MEKSEQLVSAAERERDPYPTRDTKPMQPPPPPFSEHLYITSTIHYTLFTVHSSSTHIIVHISLKKINVQAIAHTIFLPHNLLQQQVLRNSTKGFLAAQVL